MVGDGHPPIASGQAGLRHLQHGVLAIGPGGVHVEVAPDVCPSDERGKPRASGLVSSGEYCGLDFAKIFA